MSYGSRRSFGSSASHGRRSSAVKLQRMAREKQAASLRAAPIARAITTAALRNVETQVLRRATYTSHELVTGETNFVLGTLGMRERNAVVYTSRAPVLDSTVENSPYIASGASGYLSATHRGFHSMTSDVCLRNGHEVIGKYIKIRMVIDPYLYSKIAHERRTHTYRVHLFTYVPVRRATAPTTVMTPAQVEELEHVQFYLSQAQNAAAEFKEELDYRMSVAQADIISSTSNAGVTSRLSDYIASDLWQARKQIIFESFFYNVDSGVTDFLTVQYESMEQEMTDFGCVHTSENVSNKVIIQETHSFYANQHVLVYLATNYATHNTAYEERLHDYNRKYPATSTPVTVRFTPM